ncbi:MAG: hypothetical protein ABEK50_15995 [bacterium]
MITVALERNFDDPRSYIEKANPDHPSLVDTRHRVADLYNIENVPTALWIDEDRNIVRPNDVVFGSKPLKFFSGTSSDEHISALKSWVRNEDESRDYLVSDDRRSEHQTLPSDDQLTARAEFHLAQWLYEQDHRNKAQRHFEKACELAPEDTAIQRGSMRMRNENPMGWAFIKMVIRRFWNGLSYYNPLPTKLK